MIEKSGGKKKKKKCGEAGRAPAPDGPKHSAPKRVRLPVRSATAWALSHSRWNPSALPSAAICVVYLSSKQSRQSYFGAFSPLAGKILEPKATRERSPQTTTRVSQRLASAGRAREVGFVALLICCKKIVELGRRQQVLHFFFACSRLPVLGAIGNLQGRLPPGIRGILRRGLLFLNFDAGSVCASFDRKRSKR